MSMLLNVSIVLATLLSANAFFLPDCLWDSDSWGIPDKNSQSRRYRRFLWDDSDVCDWLCDPDLLPHEICNSCCRRPNTSTPPADPPRQSQPIGSPQIGIQNAQPAASPLAPQMPQALNTGINGQQAYFLPPQVQVPVLPNQNWPQNGQQPLPQNGNSPAQPQLQNPSNTVPVTAPLNNEPLNFQVPINLTGLFQAQVPPRFTAVFQNEPRAPAQNGQSQGIPSATVNNVQTQIQPPANGDGGSGFPNSANGQSQPQPQQELPIAGQQVNQPAQQFQTAGQQVNQPDQSAPQPQSQPDPSVAQPLPADTNGSDVDDSDST